MVDTGWIEKSAAKEKAKVQKHLAQGNTLGNIHTRMSPCKGKSMILHCGNAFALTGRIYSIMLYPGRCPGLGAFGPSARVPPYRWEFVP